MRGNIVWLEINGKSTGAQKAAILFITLGPEASSGIIKKLPESQKYKK